MLKDMMKIFVPGVKLLFAALMMFALLSFFANRYVFIGEVLVIVGLGIFYVRLGLTRKKTMKKYMEELTHQVEAAGKGTLIHFPLPMVVLRRGGAVSWYNAAFSDLLSGGDLYLDINIRELIEDFPLAALEGEGAFPLRLSILERRFDVFGNVLSPAEGGNEIIALYFVERTELYDLKDEIGRRESLVGIILIDNYDEIMQTAREIDRSAASAEIDRVIAAWAEGGRCLLQRFYNDKYLVVMEEWFLKECIDQRFPLLDEVKEVLVGPGRMPATLTIGIGKGFDGFQEKLEGARAAIEVALGRGGDQVVIKNGGQFECYGGKTKEMEKRTKVKSRVISNALRELILESRKVYIMGHRFADIDAVGAAIGIAHIVRETGKEPSIVLGPRSDAVVNLLDMIGPAYKGLFVTPQQAIDYMEANTLLVVVDTNNPSYVESEELLNLCRTVVVVDHHRRGGIYIDKTALTYHEPYASSTCELVTEMIQYLNDSEGLSSEEATALLAGVMLDTKGFMLKTGVRTFEAASYLKRCGADTGNAKGVFSNDLEQYRLRSTFVAKAKIYFEHVAVALWEDEESPGKEILAQAVDEMLSLRGIRAAFGLALIDGAVHVSARSFGEINVQIILERLGGGGHQTMAGVQISEKTPREVYELLIEAIEDATREEE